MSGEHYLFKSRLNVKTGTFSRPVTHMTLGSTQMTHPDFLQGSHYILVVKFKDLSRTFKDPEVAFSRTNSWRKFPATFNIYFCDYGTVFLVPFMVYWHSPM